MYDAANVTRWLEAQEGLASADRSVPVSHYRAFYSLEVPNTHHEMGFLDVADDRICVQRFSQHTNHLGTVFLLHGYLDHSGLHNKAVRRLLEIGYDVVLYDQPGHGLSSGLRASIHTFQHYVECLGACVDYYATLPGPKIVMGHSMGGAVTMTYLLQQPDVFSRAVLIAPLYRPKSWRLLRSLHVVGRRFIERQPRRFVKNTRDADFYRFIREVDPLSPREIPTTWITSMFEWTRDFASLGPSDVKVLVVQGTQDGTVDWEGNIKVIRKVFSDVLIHLVHEGGHHLLNETEEYREPAWRVIEPFLTEHR